MIKIENSSIRFIGCGGVGMVGLALISLEMGAEVHGSDSTASVNTDLLNSYGVSVAIGHTPPSENDQIPDLVVRSSAVADENPEFAAYVDLGVPTMRRGEFLAEIAGFYGTVVAVAGSHGKTSVTALLAHILKSAGLSPGYMIGGKVNGWDTPASSGKDLMLFVTESDESDGTQIHLSPDILLLTNIEDDHSWSVGGTERLFANFAKIASEAATVFTFESEMTASILRDHPDVRFLDFLSEGEGEIRDFRERNALLAVEGAAVLGVDREIARAAVDSFPGVKRRMTVHVETPDFMLVEDYAHHPTEVRSALSVIRRMRPKSELVVVFQPHRYARLAKYLNEFARELSEGADKVFVTPVFAAWSETGAVDSANLAELIGAKASLCSSEWGEAASAILADASNMPTTLAVLGAGDIDGLVAELAKRF